MDVPLALTNAFPPSPNLLLDRVRLEVDDAMLVDIAMADYGQGADEVLPQLRSIRDTGIIPTEMSWTLSEVLALTRWCNPEKPDRPPFRPGPTGRRGHQSRLFVCAVLLRADSEWHEDTASDSTLAQCLSSAGVLGDEAVEAAGSYLTWRLTRDLNPHVEVLFPLGLLVVATLLRSRVGDAVLASAAEWVLEIESLHVRSYFPNAIEPPPLPFSQSNGFWNQLRGELNQAAATVSQTSLRENLRLCALLLET